MYIPKPKGAKIILLEYENGTTSIEELSRKTGYAKRTVYDYLCKFGDKNVCFNGKIVSRKTMQIIECIKKRGKGVNIAKKFNVSRQWVSKIKKYKMERLNND